MEQAKIRLARYEEVAQLLWQTGEPLNRAVVQAFRDLGFQAEQTPPRVTYDVTVTLPEGPRLLIEVTGIEGQIQKKSNKISQVLQVKQEVAKAGDRVVVLVNAHRDQELGKRPSDLVTPEADALLRGLDAVVIATPDLFALWNANAAEPGKGTAAVRGILAAPAGVFTLL